MIELIWEQMGIKNKYINYQNLLKINELFSLSILI